MESEEERILILRIIKFAKDRKTLTLKELFAGLNLEGKDLDYLSKFVRHKDEKFDNPNHILTFVTRPRENVDQPDLLKDEYALVPSAIFHYIDYLEIRDARKAAQEARELSLVAIQIAVWSMVIGAATGLLGIVAQMLL